MIWLIGNKGMLGQQLEAVLKESHGIIFTSDIDVDITDADALLSFANGKKIEWIINCSAYTAVDKAEVEQDKAFLINRTGVRNIAETAKLTGAKVIHISTDYVFDGTKKTPLLETDPVNPQSVYGNSKLAGEAELQQTYHCHFIIRTSWLYGKHGNNFIYTMMELMNSQDSINVVKDQRGSPTSAYDLSSFINTIIKKNSQEYGIYHFSNHGDISWYDFALEIYRLGRQMNLIWSECIINPCTSNQFPTAAKRPNFSILSKEKTEKTFHITIPNWTESLVFFLQEETRK